MNSIGKMYSVKEVAVMLGVGRDTVMRLIRRGKLRAVKLPVLVAPGEGAIMAAPEGATLPMVDGSEWGTKRAGEDFSKIFLDSDAHFGNYENTFRQLAQQEDCSAVGRRATRWPQDMRLATDCSARLFGTETRWGA